MAMGGNWGGGGGEEGGHKSLAHQSRVAINFTVVL